MYLNFNAYRLPILESITSRNGEATPDQVGDDVFGNLCQLMTYHDVTRITSGEVAWRNRMRWVKNSMVKEGLLSSGNKRGTWKITKEGTKALKHWAGI